MPDKSNFIHFDEHEHSLNNIKMPDSEQIVRLIIAVFHDHVVSLETYWNAALKPVIRILGPNPFVFEGTPTLDEASKRLYTPAREAVSAISKFIESIQHNWSDRRIQPELRDKLLEAEQELRDFVQSSSPGPHEFLSLQSAVRNIIETIESIRELKTIPREATKLVLYSAHEVERIACVFHLRQVEERVIELQEEARCLRDLFMSRTSTPPRQIDFLISDAILKAVTSINAMAVSRRVELRIQKNLPKIWIKGIEKDIRRAITNLLSNAIKYSWQLPGDKSAWVDVRVKIDAKKVLIEFENWGVPIDSDEIKTDRIFQFMERGRFSSDRARVGTGAGLWDARSIARAHDGDVFISSKPAQIDSRDIANIPHITVATLSLPVLK